jgi:hypothetical protein
VDRRAAEVGERKSRKGGGEAPTVSSAGVGMSRKRGGEIGMGAARSGREGK